MIEDSSTMDETAQFLGVSWNIVDCVHRQMIRRILQFVCWEHWQFSMFVLNDLLLEVCFVLVSVLSIMPVTLAPDCRCASV